MSDTKLDDTTNKIENTTKPTETDDTTKKQVPAVDLKGLFSGASVASSCMDIIKLPSPTTAIDDRFGEATRPPRRAGNDQPMAVLLKSWKNRCPILGNKSWKIQGSKQPVSM